MVWTMAFVYVGEIYPTLWRSTGSGLASGAARIGSMIAPQLVFTNPSLRKVFMKLELKSLLPVFLYKLIEI